MTLSIVKSLFIIFTNWNGPTKDQITLEITIFMPILKAHAMMLSLT